MQTILITLALVLVFIVIVQVGKAVELVSVLKDEEEHKEDTAKSLAFWFVISGVLVAIFIAVTVYTEWDKLLPPPASEHGVWIQDLINATLLVTGSVFVITNALLFIFTWKYRYRKGRKAFFYPENNRLELVWTIIPTIALTFLIGTGIYKWFKIFSEAPTDAIRIEASAKQFSWYIRYAGEDNTLGPRDFTLVNVDNELGVNWNDERSHDDFLADEIVLPVNTPVMVHIAALDVLHNFYLPEFRLMMDAVPGMPTKFWFKPTITTAEMREIKNDPEFDYVLACNQLCGTGHWNMQRPVRIVSESEYKEWLSEQKSFYKENILAKAEE